MHVGRDWAWRVRACELRYCAWVLMCTRAMVTNNDLLAQQGARWQVVRAAHSYGTVTGQKGETVGFWGRLTGKRTRFGTNMHLHRHGMLYRYMSVYFPQKVHLDGPLLIDRLLGLVLGPLSGSW